MNGGNMADKDKEAFEKWFKETKDITLKGAVHEFSIVWKNACEYKQKEIDELKLEIMQVKGDRNKVEFKLAVAVEALEFYMWQNKYNGYESNKSGEWEYYPAKITEDNGRTAREALAKIRKV